MLHATSPVAVEVAATAFLLTPTTALWIPPAVAGTVRLRQAGGVRVVALNRMLSRQLHSACRTVPASPLLREILNALDGGDAAMTRAQSVRLHCVLADEVARPLRQETLEVPLPADPRLRRLCQCLIDDVSDQRTLEQLGTSIGASTRTLTRLFKAETGLSFVQWRRRLRLTHAASLIQQGGRVHQVAIAVGYDTPSAFARMHRQVLGSAPTDLSY